MKRVAREYSHFFFDASLEPVLGVDPGESFWVETHDAHRGTIVDASVVYSTLDDVFRRLGGAKPVAGAVAVRGLRAGDALEVSVEELVPGARGYTCTTPTLEPSLVPETGMCARDGDAAGLPTAGGESPLPLRPMIGPLGLAPAGDRRASFSQGRDVLGNV